MSEPKTERLNQAPESEVEKAHNEGWQAEYDRMIDLDRSPEEAAEQADALFPPEDRG